jgi:hypothetical protein
MRAAVGSFPQADLDKAAAYVTAYTKDPRNANARIVENERKVYLTLPPSKWDPTGKPIHVEGTLDQLREENGVLYVWDYKTGAPGGWEMVHSYAYQLCAYSLAASQTLGRECRIGGIIRARGYFIRDVLKPEVSPDGVFFHVTTTPAQATLMMERLKLIVAGIRAGSPLYGPGEHCRLCPHGGLGQCLELGHRKGLNLL